VVHCYAGKDRTGTLVALLQMRSLNPDEIVADYLSSGMDVLPEKIREVLNYRAKQADS
jgi:protein tyrosine/serine phosphatase